jgi:hypothetical protein
MKRVLVGSAVAALLFVITATPSIAAVRLQCRLFTQVAAGSSTESDRSIFASGDLNGDGRLDVVAPGAGDSLAVLLGRGDGTFEPPLTFHAQYAATNLAVADFDGDGALDIAWTAGFLGAGILFGDGTASHWTPVSLASADCYGIAVGDFDGDGKRDAVCMSASHGLRVFLARSSRTFQGITTTVDSIGGRPLVMRVADFDRDGRADLAIAMTSWPKDVAILLGNGDGTFSYRRVPNYANGARRGIDAADVTGDGVPDLVLTNYEDAHLSLLTGHGDGTFASAQAIPAGAQGIRDVVIADATGDGIPDLVATSEYPSGIVTHPGLGGGAFGTPIFSTTHRKLVPLSTGDLDGDGHVDLVALDMETGRVVSALNDGTGTFGSAAPEIVLGASGQLLAKGDLNGDGRPDLVVIRGGDTLEGVLNMGQRSFQVMSGAAVTGSPGALRLADMDEDGRLDALVLSSPLNSLSMFHGNGDGTFASPSVITIGPSLEIADLDGDGHLDVLTASGNNVRVLRGLGNGTFASPLDSPMPGAVSGPTARDIDGDGHLDVAFAIGSSTLQIARGRGDGRFDFLTSVTLGGTALWWSLEDTDGDGRADLLASTGGGCLHCGVMRAWMGTATGVRGAPIDTSIPWDVVPVQFADVDHAHGIDLVVRGAGEVQLGLRDGSGRFAFEAGYGCFDRVTDLATADFEGDGRLDVAVVGTQEFPVTPPTITFLYGRDPDPATTRVDPPSPSSRLGPKAVRITALGPNPTEGRFTVEFEIPRTARARIALFDIHGREAASLMDATCPAGSGRIQWKAPRLRAGVYCLLLASEGETDVRRIVVLGR